MGSLPPSPSRSGPQLVRNGILNMTLTRRSSAVIALIVALLVLAAMFGLLEPQNNPESTAPVQAIPGSRPATAAPIDEFPEGELRSSLIKLCSGERGPSKNEERTAEEIQAETETLNELMQNISDRLSVSPSTEHLHVAALLEDDSRSRIELLHRAISQSPNEPFLMWSAVRICTEESDATACDLADWERQLLMIDGQNSESWLRVAANRYKAGETDAALEAMRQAATAAETRIYLTETIEMIERGFTAAGSDYTFAERARMAFGIAATKLQRDDDYTTMCKAQSLRSADWAYTCLGYGELAENQGKTDISVTIGRAIQKLALEALGEEDKLAAVKARQQAFRQERLDDIGEDYAIIERLMFSNPTIFSAYLAAIRTHGEAGARAYLADETRRLLREHPELACEP